MPTYLVHGFRWQRANIRIHIILQDLEDAAAEWIVAPATSLTILNSFYRLYDFLPPSHPPKPTYPAPVPTPENFPPPPPIPDDDVHMCDNLAQPRKTLSKKNTRSMVSLRSMARKQKPQSNSPNPNQLPEQQRPPTAPRPATARYAPPTRHSNSLRVKKAPAFNDWSAVKLLEQYDPTDMYSVSQPYAYVADHIVEVTLGASLAEEMSKYEAKMRSEEMPDSPVSADPQDLGMPNGGENPAGSGMNGTSSARKTGHPGWLEKLRDGLQKGCDIGWFVVVCGDEERVPPPAEILRGRYSSRPSMTSDGSSSMKTQRSGFRGLFRRKVVVEE